MLIILVVDISRVCRRCKGLYVVPHFRGSCPFVYDISFARDGRQDSIHTFTYVSAIKSIVVMEDLIRGRALTGFEPMTQAVVE